MSSFFKMDPRKILAKKGIILNQKQEEIVQSVEENKVTVVVATRRGGKSEIASSCNVAKLLEPTSFCGITAPYLNHTGIIFDNIADTFKNTLELKPTKLNNKDKNIKFEWGAEAKASTLKNRAQIAGRAYDLFTGDEVGLADYMENSNWLFQEVLPALITTQGHVLIISTPRGLNHLYDLWEAAEKEADWNRIRYTIWDCDHIPKEEIIRMERLYKEQHMEKMWEQEFLASFVSFEGSVYNFMPEPTTQTPDPDLIITGIDPGSITGIVKVHISKEHGVFVTYAEEQEGSTNDTGLLLQGLTEDSELNIYDSAAKQFAIDMAYEYDIPMTKANKDVDQGINFMRRLDGHLFYSTDISDTFKKEWSMYCHKDGRIVKKNDHILDALRYALFSAYTFWPEYFPFLNADFEDFADTLTPQVKSI